MNLVKEMLRDEVRAQWSENRLGLLVLVGCVVAALVAVFLGVN